MTVDPKTQARAYHAQGRTIVWIAGILGATKGQVQHWLGSKLHDAKQAAKKGTKRPCLGCKSPFDSAGPHNRMCDKCRKEAQGIPPGMIDAGDGCSIGRRGN